MAERENQLPQIVICFKHTNTHAQAHTATHRHSYKVNVQSQLILIWTACIWSAQVHSYTPHRGIAPSRKNPTFAQVLRHGGFPQVTHTGKLTSSDLRYAELLTRKPVMQPSWKTPPDPGGRVCCVRTLSIRSFALAVWTGNKRKALKSDPSLCSQGRSRQARWYSCMLICLDISRLFVRNAGVCSLPTEILTKMPYETHNLGAYL